MFTALDISVSGLVAQRARLDAVSSNIANMSTQRNENGELKPYEARYVVFQADDGGDADRHAVGVKVDTVQTETVKPRYRHEPNHPLAIQEGPHKGYVAYPAVNMTMQFVDALEATRAYEANVGVMEITKGMFQQSLRILA